ncbi:SGNH/GDSL hydrolase family protein [Marivirga harenae]|uniref:SGNH/GDSL hydrolase family protein n=1 Tax=Marivirga harenae TaxID=2010992 RepID=UPI0026DFD8A9|nr:SGNH/GDSL hydrolase family protein [Marivirga harenae]WKV13235.1 SGNH/GDSL hydrolase family protein [Marivirga harenae]
MRQNKNFYHLFTIISILIIIGCENSTDQIDFDDIETNEPEVDESDIQYLALGDSYTIGQGVPEEESWPAQLSRRIEQETSLKVEVDIIAQTGWTTSNLMGVIESYDINSGDYNLVSLLIGVNNQYQGKDFSLYETEFDSLLQIAIDIAGDSGDVFVVSIPDYGVTPFGSSNSDKIGKEIDQYNTYAKSVCNNKNIPFIDVTSISRELGSSSDALTNDNLHPSGFQYSLWTDRIYSKVLQLIGD